MSRSGAPRRRADDKIAAPTLASLFEIWQVSTSLDPDTLIREVVPKLASVTGAHRVSLMRLDATERFLTVHTAVGLPADMVARARVPVGEPIAGWVVQEGRALLLPDGPNVPAVLRNALKRAGIVSALCVPLRSRDRIVGVLNLTRLEGRPFTRKHLWFASLLSERLASCLEVARLYDELEARHILYTSVVEGIPLSVVVVDRALRVVSVNRHFLEKTRREAGHTLGQRISEVFPPVLTQVAGLEEKIAEVFRTGRPVEGSRLAYRAPGSSTRLYFYRVIMLQAAGVEERAMLLLEDVTERERLEGERVRAERHLASVVECATDLVMSLSPGGLVLSWNRAAEAVTGFTADHAIGMAVQDLCAAGHRDAMIELVHRVSHGATIPHAEIPLMTKEAGLASIAWSSAPMTDDNNRITAIVAIGRDLAERLHLEAQLVQSAKMASLGVMAGGIAHELRNPLAIAAAASQLVLEQPDDEALRAEALEKIQRSIQRASLIIEGLLKFAKPMAGPTRNIGVNALLQETCAMLRDQMAVQKVTVTMDPDPRLPRVQANENLLQQVFTNLILNACHAMPEGGTLTISTGVDEHGWLVVRFMDTGIGIQPNHLSRIFDPFFTTLPVGQGVGLGLSISQRIIEQYKGTIEAASGGTGTTFTVRLPAATSLHEGPSQEDHADGAD